MRKTGKKRSFATRLSLNVLLISSLLYLVASFFAALSSYRIISEEATKSSVNMLHGTINNIEATLGRIEAEVEGASWLVEEKKDDPDYLYHITGKLVEEDFIVGSSIAFDKYYRPGEYYFAPYSFRNPDTGEIESMQLGNPQYDYFYMDWFQIPYLLGEPCWSEPYFDEGGGRYMMTTYSYPLKDETGRVYAVITADLSLGWISDMISEIKPYANSYLTLISRSGRYITGDDSALYGETIFSTAMCTGNDDIMSIAAEMAAGKEGTRHYLKDGQARFCVFGPLSNGWRASITCGYKEVLHSSNHMLSILSIMAVLGLLLLFFLTNYAIRKMTRPLSKFSESALSIADGNFNTELPEIDTEDEVGQLRDSFDHMQRSLSLYIDELKETTAANERYESELNIANKIQMAMLPVNFPEQGNVSVDALLKPAKEVGGDLYDFQLNGSTLYFVIGDVSGKGIPAAMFMAVTRLAFRLFLKLGFGLDEIVSRMNDSVCDGNERGMFVTFFAGRLDLETGELEYCNAGHNPAVVIGADGKSSFLPVKSNIALGVFSGFPFQKQQCTLEKGSRLVLYTDGVTEAERADKEQYGEARLLEWAGSGFGPDNGKPCACLYEDVRRFVEGNEQNDDITIMTIGLE